MIHKVNRPAYLSLIESPQKPNMDPGSSQGGGNAYEKTPHSGAENSEKRNAEEKQDEQAAHKPAEILASEQIGVNEVVKDFLEQKKNGAQVNPGLTVRYANDSQPAKGLLLNKKVE